MDASSPPSDAERELDELRRRAYGPHHDIEDDPVALAKLTELEAARRKKLTEGAETKTDELAPATEGAPVADFAWNVFGADQPDTAADIAPTVEPSEGPPRSLWQRTTARRARRGWFVTGALVAFLALAYALDWLIPQPDATLPQIADEADDVVFLMLDVLGADVDQSSIRGYASYRGVEPWFAVDRQGLECFMIIDRSGPTVDGANCVPPGVGLFADIGVWPQMGGSNLEGLPDGSIIRFHHRGDTVDASLYPASETD